MKLFVLDTNAFILYLERELKLISPIVKRFFALSEMGECIFYVPTICFWEINRKFINKKFILKGLSPEEAIKLAHAAIDNSSIFRDLPLSRRASSIAPTFSSKLPDPFDQLIVASAIDANLPLITRDVNIQNSKLIRTIW